MPSGPGPSSRTRTKRSSIIWPALTSGIDALLERLDPDALDGIDEQLIPARAQLDIGYGEGLDHVSDLTIRHRRSQNRSALGALIGTSTDRDLGIFLAVFLHAQN